MSNSRTRPVCFYSSSVFLFPSVCGAEIFIEPRIGFHGVFPTRPPFPAGNRTQQLWPARRRNPRNRSLERRSNEGRCSLSFILPERSFSLAPIPENRAAHCRPRFHQPALENHVLQPDRYGIAGDRSAALLFTLPGDSACERRQYDSSGLARFLFDESFGCPHVGRVAARSESIARRLAFDSLRPVVARSFSVATPCSRHLADGWRKNGDSREPQLFPLPGAGHQPFSAGSCHGNQKNFVSSRFSVRATDDHASHCRCLGAGIDGHWGKGAGGGTGYAGARRNQPRKR